LGGGGGGGGDNDDDDDNDIWWKTEISEHLIVVYRLMLSPLLHFSPHSVLKQPQSTYIFRLDSDKHPH
jgi:hypothetical protein